MDVYGRKFFTEFGRPYASMEPWERRTYLKIFGIADGCFFMVPYLAFMVLPYLVLKDEWTSAKFLIAMWSLWEILFHIYALIRMEDLKHRKQILPPMSEEKRLRLARRICEHMDDDALNGWLVNRPAGRLNIREISAWLVWAFFGKDPLDLDKQEFSEAAAIINLFRDRLGDSDPPRLGSNASMRPTLDPMQSYPRPLVLHAALVGLKLLSNVKWVMDGLGWRSAKNGLPYLFHEPEQEEGMPIMFLHGGGFGLYMYPLFISFLVKNFPKRKILLPYIASVSNTPNAKIYSPAQLIEAFDDILATNGIHQISLFGNSYGTLISGLFINHRPSRIGRITLVEPIMFELWDSNLVYTLIYSQPSAIAHHVLNILSVDPVLDALLHTLWLPEYLLFPEDIKPTTYIYTGQHDWIAQGPKTANYLLRRKQVSNLDHLHVELVDMSHGEFSAVNKLMVRFTQHL